MNIYTKIPLISGELGAIDKNSRNREQGYSFRGIEDMYNAIHPLLAKHGVFCAPSVVEKAAETYTNKNGTVMRRVELTVQHRFFADDGSFVDVVTAGEGMDSADKATNKAMSAAMKYAFIELFSIPTKDIEDADRESPVLDASAALIPVQKKTTLFKPDQFSLDQVNLQLKRPGPSTEASLPDQILAASAKLSSAHQEKVKSSLDKIPSGDKASLQALLDRVKQLS